MDKKLNQINFHSFFEICTMLSGIHFLAQFISLCIYAIKVGSSYYGEVSGLQLAGNIIYSTLPTFFTFVIILGITLLYFQLVPKKVQKVEEAQEINDKIDEIHKEEEELLDEIMQAVNPMPKYSMKMKKAELLEIAESMGLKIDKSVKKEEIIKALDNLKQN